MSSITVFFLFVLMASYLPSFDSYRLHQHQIESQDDRTHTNYLDDHVEHNHVHNDYKKCLFENPSIEEEHLNQQQLKLYRESIGEKTFQNRKNDIIDINVYVHVIMKQDWTGFLETETIKKQIDILNEAFGGQKPRYSECEGFLYGSTYETPFRFELKRIFDYQDDDAFNLANSNELRKRERVGTCADLNIFTGYYENFLGLASAPQGCPKGNSNEINLDDNVRINYNSFPDIGFFEHFDQGDTLIHEVGHWLGLLHPFHEDCLEPNDHVSDTPVESISSNACEIDRDSCPFSAGSDPIHNFMDFSYDCCLYQFTEGQSDRMILMSGLYRGLSSSIPTPAPSPEPNIDITPTCRFTEKNRSHYLSYLFRLVMGRL